MRLRVRAFAAAAVFSAVLCTQAFAYTDVDSSFWCAKMIESMQNDGVFDGLWSGDTFSPQKEVTRGEFLTLLMKACAKGKTSQLSTADALQVAESERMYIGEAQKEGVFTGITENGAVYADADSVLTREDAAVYIGRFLNATSANKLDFYDSGEISAYAYPYVSALCEKEIITGSGGYFYPTGHITRAQAVSLIYKTSELEQQSNSAQSTSAAVSGLKTIAGVSSTSYRDGSTAVALFSRPLGIEAGSDGIYVADTGNNLIRKISADTVSTVTGTFTQRDYSGQAFGLYNDTVLVKAGFSAPSGISVGSNSYIYIADSKNNVIRVIKNGNVYTYSGTGKAGLKNGGPAETMFNMPMDVACDKNGNLYVADTMNSCIRIIDKNRDTRVFAGIPQHSGFADGTDTSAMFCEPCAVAVGDDGAVYVSDSGNQRIRKIKNGHVTTLAGGGETDADTGYVQAGFADGKGSEARFAFPQGICVGGTAVFVADSKNNAVRKISSDGTVTTIAGTGDAGISDGGVGVLDTPCDVTYKDGVLYIADTMNSAIRQIAVDTH